MALEFYKYQGTGNDFIIIDNRSDVFIKNNTSQIAFMCDRRFGIGADGLILLEDSDDADFNMVYYNADGNESSMCGNGGRCITHFANYLNLISDKAEFMAIDGLHTATIESDKISLRMGDVSEVNTTDGDLFLDTGSPHHVKLVTDLENYDVDGKGRKIRREIYGKEGANVNFVEQLSEDSFSVRTYERGVEGETLSCGTGVTAVALAMHHAGKTSSHLVKLKTPGGLLEVTFKEMNGGYTDIHLIGPAKLVYKGIWD